MQMKNAVFAAAVATLFLANAAAAKGKSAKKTVAVSCEGINECKGHGSCKSAHNACSGQNGCKGQGVTKTSEKECSAKGGKVALAENEKH
jgi:hypothetical protein